MFLNVLTRYCPFAKFIKEIFPSVVSERKTFRTFLYWVKMIIIVMNCQTFDTFLVTKTRFKQWTMDDKLLHYFWVVSFDQMTLNWNGGPIDFNY